MRRFLNFPLIAKSWLSCQGYKLLDVRIRCTFRCNSRCMFCAIGQGNVDIMPYEMQTKDFFILFDVLKKFGTKRVHLSGGEPTMREDLPDLISYAKRCGFFVSLRTNGLFPRDLAKKIIQNKLDLVTFSIDSANPDVHDKLRGLNGSWEKVIESLVLMSFLRRKMKAAIRLKVNTVITTMNFNELHKMLDLKASLDFDEISFSPLVEYIPLGERLALTGDEVRYFNRQIAPKIQEKSKRYHVLASVPPFGRFEKAIDQDKKPRSAHTHTYCFIPWFSLEILPNGDIIPCDYAGTGNEIVMGNVLLQSLNDIWNGKKFVEFRKNCRPPSWLMCRSCWCYLNTNLYLMQKYRRIPKILRNFLEYKSRI